MSLSFFAIVYFFIAFNTPLPGWEATFLALAACYVVAFFAVVAEWFWGRWFATGLGWSGLMVAIVSVVMIGWDPGAGDLRPAARGDRPAAGRQVDGRAL